MNSSFDSTVQSETKSATQSLNSSVSDMAKSPKQCASASGSKLNSLINTLTSAKNETKLNDKSTNGSALSAAETLLEFKNFFGIKSDGKQASNSGANDDDDENENGKENIKSANDDIKIENSFNGDDYDDKQDFVISPASNETDEEEQKILEELQNDNGNF